MEHCVDCGVDLTIRNTMSNGRCSRCHGKRLAQGIDPKLIARASRERETEDSVGEKLRAESAASEAQREVSRKARAISLTTEAFVGQVDRLGVVATEVVLGMNIFKDVLANVRDIFGGRSGTIQNTLEDAREAAFEDLRLKAAKLGADAVISVDIDYHSISTGSSVNMMMVAVSGTAIKWPDELPKDQLVTR